MPEDTGRLIGAAEQGIGLGGWTAERFSRTRSSDLADDPPLLSRNVADAEERFQQLAQRWRRDTAPAASPRAMAMHPSYQQIIGMGREAVPLILRDLQRQPDHWFWALAHITGEDPVPTEQRGRIDAMADAWIAWGKQHGYLNERA